MLFQRDVQDNLSQKNKCSVLLPHAFRSCEWMSTANYRNMSKAEARGMHLLDAAQFNVFFGYPFINTTMSLTYALGTQQIDISPPELPRWKQPLWQGNRKKLSCPERELREPLHLSLWSQPKANKPVKDGVRSLKTRSFRFYFESVLWMNDTWHMRYECTPNSSVKVKKHSFIYRLFSCLQKLTGFMSFPPLRPTLWMISRIMNGFD